MTDASDIPSKNEEAVRYLAKHFVSLTWQDRTSGERASRNDGAGEHFAVSGFLASINGVWFLVTAGHILRDIKGAIAAGQRLEAWRLDDAWSSEAKTHDGVPFDFDDAAQMEIDEEGADYGLIYLRPLIREALRANGCDAIDESSWSARWPDNFDFYVLLGLPDELMNELSGGRVEKYLVALPVTPIAEPPARLQRRWPRWYGKVPLPLQVSPDRWLTSIKGMSGGPFFAFSNTAAGQAYWIVGIQSEWDPEEKVIAACPSKYFFEMACRRLARAELPPEIE